LELWRVPWGRFGFSFCMVYLIGPKMGWPTKIGIAEHVSSRLTDLQVSHWSELVIHSAWLCASSGEARKVEKASHETLNGDGKRMRGEWVDVRPADATEVVEFCARTMDVEMVTKLPDTDKFGCVRKYLNGLRNRKEATVIRLRRENFTGNEDWWLYDGSTGT